MTNAKARIVLLEINNFKGAKTAALAEVHAMAVEHDAQIIVERVGDADDGAFVIEDGTMRGES